MSEMEQDRLTEDQARSLNDLIKSTIQELEDLLSEFITGEGWLALGYETAWEWWTEEIGERRLGGSTRDKVILQFKKEEVSQRKIAKAVGVSPPTVREALRETSGRNLPVNTEQPPLEPTEILDKIEDDYTEEDAKKFEEQVRKELAEKQTVPFDIPNDEAIFIQTESVADSLEAVKRRATRDIDSKTKAKLMIELQIIRDMIDLIENML